MSTRPHPYPYKLRWLDENTGNYVKRQCLVSFKKGSYEDHVLCDVLNMDARHILLGRAWQHDRDTKHNGVTNVYTLRHEGKIKDLVPLPPHKAFPLPMTKQPIHLISRKSCVKEIRASTEVFILFTKVVFTGSHQTNSRLTEFLTKFQDVFPSELLLAAFYSYFIPIIWLCCIGIFHNYD